jgi:hypothetical protein
VTAAGKPWRTEELDFLYLEGVARAREAPVAMSRRGLCADIGDHLRDPSDGDLCGCLRPLVADLHRSGIIIERERL